MVPKRASDEDPATSAPDKKKAKHGFRVGPDNLPDGAWKRKVTKIKKELITKAKVKKQYAKIKAQKEAEAAAASSVPIGPILDAHNGTEDDNDKKNGNEIQKGADVDVPAPIHASRQILLKKGAAAKAARAEAEAEQQQQQQQQQQTSVDEELSLHNDEQQKYSQPTTTEPQKAADDDQPYIPPPMDRPQEDPIDPNMHPSRLPKRYRKPNYYEKELALAEKKKKAAEERAAEIAQRKAEKQKRIAERERYRKQMAKARQPGARDGKIKLGRQGGLLLDKVKRIVGQQ